jgi:hypothetical protein
MDAVDDRQNRTPATMAKTSVTPNSDAARLRLDPQLSLLLPVVCRGFTLSLHGQDIQPHHHHHYEDIECKLERKRGQQQPRQPGRTLRICHSHSVSG